VIKSYEVVITETAQKDMVAIWDYIAMDSIGNAGKFLNQLEEKICSLEYLPERGHVIPESEYLRTTRYRHLIHKKYRLEIE